MLLVEEFFIIKVVLFHSALLYWANLSPVSFAILMLPACSLIGEPRQIITLKPSYLDQQGGGSNFEPPQNGNAQHTTAISRIVLFLSHVNFKVDIG